jgi:hypothetical protein
LLVEYGRPIDDHGEPVELDELSDLVRTVQASELWSRAMRAERVLVEVPFAVPFWRAVSPQPSGGERTSVRGGERPQLDLFGGSAPPPAPDPTSVTDDEAPAASDPQGPPTVLEGVIDLAFQEPDGWVIADYKTDVGSDPEFVARSASYRRQVDLYAEAWITLTGEPVKERVLFFTANEVGGREVRW